MNLEEPEARVWAAIISGAVAVLGLGRRWFVRQLKAAWVYLRGMVFTRADLARLVDDRFAILVEQIAALSNKLDHVVKESSPNGGSTMKDVLNRIGRDVRVLEAKSRAYKEGVEVPVGEADAAGRLVWCSGAFLQLLGATEDEVHGASWLNFIADHDTERVARTWEKAVRDRGYYRSRHYMRSASGREFPVEVIARPIYDTVTDQFNGWVWRLWERGQTGQQPAVVFPPAGTP
jgi:PAS domain S-box-containing protein